MAKAFAHRKAGKTSDYFNTHYSLSWQGVDIFNFNKSFPVLEPAAGSGAMASALAKKGFENITATDLFPQAVGIEKKNFLHDNFDPYPYIITNPPNSHATDFVTRAKYLYTRNIAFLLRLNFLSGQQRCQSDVYDELKYVYVFSRMPDFREDVSPLRADGKYKTAMHVYAWMIWEKDYHGEPVFRSIDNSMYVLRKGDL